MSAAPQAHLLDGGRRLHLHHGPIDLIIGVEGPQRDAAFVRATERFQTVLNTLVGELAMLRAPLATGSYAKGPTARRMVTAVRPFSQCFVTPMAAVAGAVADEVLAAMKLDRRTPKAYVNNGGDVAFHLAGEDCITSLCPAGVLTLEAAKPSRGVATSGWQGRSHSLGIADAVTVAAPTAAAADVAATLIANAVDLPDHPAVRRIPAHDLSPDSDLGDRPVTTHVGRLNAAEIETALLAGASRARDFIEQGLICEAALLLQSRRMLITPQSTLIGDPIHA